MAMTRKDLHEYALTFYQFKREMKHESPFTLYTLDKIHHYEMTLHRLFELACNRELTLTETQKINDTEFKVVKIAKSLGFSVRFNSDPRGGAIRFILPSQVSNNWDGETWGIYW